MFYFFFFLIKMERKQIITMKNNGIKKNIHLNGVDKILCILENSEKMTKPNIIRYYYYYTHLTILQ